MNIIQISTIIGVAAALGLTTFFVTIWQSISNDTTHNSDVKIGWIDATNLANKTASQYSIFSEQTTWNVHIQKDGTLYALNGKHEIDKNLSFSCSFSVIPNDASDHFAYLSVFRSSDSGYVVALDEKTGKIIDAKPIPYESAVCGP